MVTASLLGDLFIGALLGAGLLGVGALRSRRTARRPRRPPLSPRRLVHDIPIGRIVIASGLARSRRG